MSTAVSFVNHFPGFCNNLPVGSGSENQLPPWMTNFWSTLQHCHQHQHHHHCQGNGLNRLITELQQVGQILKGQNNPLGQQLLDLAQQLAQAEGGQHAGWPPGGSPCSHGTPSENNAQLVQLLLTDAAQLLSNNGSPMLAMLMIKAALRLLGFQQFEPFSDHQFPTSNFIYV